MSELPKKQVKRLRTLIQEAETNLAAAKELLISIVGDDGQVVTPKNPSDEVAGKVIEGVFDGQMMLSPDGKNYPIPANYASKSKLVEGDLMKLTIAEDGSFIYKQIGPVPRKQVIGTLVQHDPVADPGGGGHKLVRIGRGRQKNHRTRHCPSPPNRSRMRQTLQITQKGLEAPFTLPSSGRN